MRGSPDYSINYVVMGFYPITNAQAEQLVNDWAASLGSNGWDQIRAMSLGTISGVVIDGNTYNISIEGDSTGGVIDSGSTVYIYVYSTSDQNSVSSFDTIAGIANATSAANQVLANTSAVSAAGSTLMGALGSVGTVALVALGAFLIFSFSKGSK